MAGIKFTPNQIKELLQNKVIKSITPKMMTFTKDFKRKAVAETAKGKTIYQVVKNAGLDLRLFPKRYLYDQLKSWRKQNLDTLVKRGRPSALDVDLKDLSAEQLRAKCTLQEAEIEFLKKVLALD